MIYAFIVLLFSIVPVLASDSVQMVAAGGNNVIAADAFPAGIIIMSTSSCPTGWSELISWRGRFPMGAPTGVSLGVTSGTAYTTNLPQISLLNHTHAVTPAALLNVSVIGAASGAAATAVISSSASTGGGNASEIPYVQTLFCIKN